MKIESCQGCGNCVSCRGVLKAEYDRDLALDEIEELLESLATLRHSLATDAIQKTALKTSENWIKIIRNDIGRMVFKS